jgi:putative spermidine/putrescine transport system ATP-binding protein/spermidine/putrescine transport system ATP-binding protein
MGDVAFDAPGAAVAALSIGDRLDVFVRPEHLILDKRGAPGSLPGTVAAQVFQGDHVDLYIDMPGLANARVLLRAPGIAALTAYPAGAEVGVLVNPVDIVAFPPEGSA